MAAQLTNKQPELAVIEGKSKGGSMEPQNEALAAALEGLWDSMNDEEFEAFCRAYERYKTENLKANLDPAH